MAIFEKNLNVLKEIKPLYEMYQEQLYKVEKTKNGQYTFKINNIYQHSKYDPQKEAQRILNFLTKEKEKIDIFIIYGAGLGYVLKLLFDDILKDNDSVIQPYIIYIEPDPKIFLLAMHYVEFYKMLENENFKIFVDVPKEVIGSFIQTIPTKRIRYYHHRPSYLLNEKYYKEVQNYINYVLDRKDMNNATFKRFQKLWAKNFIQNLPRFINAHPINKLFSIAMQSSVALIAGGPTLEKSIQYLQDNKESLIIIAVDTVYKYLKKHNITPDIVITIDPQFWNYKYLENEKITDSIIVTDSSIYHQIFDVADDNVFFIPDSIFPLVKYFDPIDNRETLTFGGSVATVAFDTARKIGAKEIILIGLDLSFPNKMTHFRGAFFENNFLTFSTYYKTAEKMSVDYLTHAPLEYEKSTTGDFVITDSKMKLFKKWFDREVPLSSAKIYQPNLGGVKIDNTIICSLNELPTGDKNIKKSFTEKVKEIKITHQTKDYPEISKKLFNILHYAPTIRNICKKITVLIPTTGEVNENNVTKIENLEAKLLNDPAQKEVTQIISSIAQDIFLSISENVEYNKDSKKSAWIKSKLLYEAIAELSIFFEKNIKKMLKKNETLSNNIV